MEEGSITKWRKNVGDHVAPGDVLFEVATDKATVEHSALDGGFLRSILVNIGEGVRVGQAIAVFSLSKDEDISSYKPEGVVQEQEAPKEEVLQAAPKPKEEKPMVALGQPAFTPEPPLVDYSYPFLEGMAPLRTKASPYAKKLAKEQGVDLTSVKGSGPRGMVVSKDLALAQKGPKVFGSKEAPHLPPGSYEEEALSPMRRVIATRLQQSKSFIPHFYVTQKIDAEPMVELREQLKAGGVKVTFNDIIVRAAALSLKEHPTINSGFNSVNQSIIRFKTIDISIAVSVEAGLITPILRHADYKNLGQIAVEVRHLAERAKVGALAREEYVGGSFTISNLGMYGISSFQGIINPPQAAILCIGGIEERLILKEGTVFAGKCMTLSLSADHRVIDGSDAAKFMKTLQNFLENPALLLM